jgi:hypothetical protein
MQHNIQQSHADFDVVTGLLWTIAQELCKLSREGNPILKNLGFNMSLPTFPTTIEELEKQQSEGVDASEDN